jgi:YHS domain-containing protein
MMKLIYYAIVAYLIYQVLKIFQGKGRRSTPSSDPRAVRSGIMVKDEACQTYLPRENALRETIDGQERFFCSQECRTKFLEERKRSR